MIQCHYRAATDVIWADASKYFNMSLTGDVRGAVNRLAGRSAYAFVHCGVNCTRRTQRYMPMGVLLNRSAIDGFAGLIPQRELGNRLYQRRGLMNAHMMWLASSQNRELARAWTDMALQRPESFCYSHAQDQAALTVLAINRSLPLLDTCEVLAGRKWLANKCCDEAKDLNLILDFVSRGNFSVTVAGRTKPPVAW